MASLRDIRKRIRSVKSSQKITKAMKLVAASKLKRAQEAIAAARPYAEEIGTLLQRVAARAAKEADSAPHPLLDVRPAHRVLLVVITSDRGLCGAFNATVLRRAERFLAEHHDKQVEIATVGRKAREYFRNRQVHATRDFPALLGELSFQKAYDIAQGLAAEYIDLKLDAVYLLYNEFKSAISQKIVVRDVLPVAVAAPEAGNQDAGRDTDSVDYIYEPDRTTVLEHLIPRYVATQVWRALLESVASEHGARMTAMDSATRNARELTEKLTLQYNRARQATITRELMDIVGGAEALNG